MDTNFRNKEDIEQALNNSRKYKKHQRIRPGAQFKTRDGTVLVLEYISSNKVRIRFLATGFETVCQASRLRSGNVRDKLHPNVHGVGFYGLEGGPNHSAHASWHSMLGRCYYRGGRGNYKDATVCEKWHNLGTYSAWYDLEVAAAKATDKTLQLDKDLHSLVNGQAKVYSPETCVLLPRAVNLALARLEKQLRKISEASFTCLPAGLTWRPDRKKLRVLLPDPIGFGGLFDPEHLALACAKLRAMRIEQFKTYASRYQLSDKAKSLIHKLKCE